MASTKAYAALGTKKTYQRCFGQGGFLGADLSAPPSGISMDRLSVCENMWRDYDNGGGYLETFPGVRELFLLDGRIYGIFGLSSGDAERILIHCDASLYVAQPDMPNVPPEKIYEGMACRKSTGFYAHSTFCLLDGEHFVLVSEDSPGQFSVCPAQNRYTPTVYIDGEMYEQPNALSDTYKEKVNLIYPDKYQYGTPELIYEITDEDALLCRVTGISQKTELVYIPSSVKLGGTLYSVTEVGERAFQNDNTVKYIYVSDGVTDIARYSMNGCNNLQSVHLGRSVTSIGCGALAYCPSLTLVAMGGAVKSIDKYAFFASNALQNVRYWGDETQWSAITTGENNEPLSAATVEYECCSDFLGRLCAVCPTEKCSSILSVCIDGTELTDEYTLTEDTVFAEGTGYYTKTDGVFYAASVTAGDAVNGEYYTRHSLSFYTETSPSDGTVCTVVIRADDIKDLSGRCLTLEAVYADSAKSKNRSTFMCDSTDATVTEEHAICSCTVAACFDSRIFLTGSPYFPNTVFYSSRDSAGGSNPSYFGVCDYFLDGTSKVPIRAMTATATALFVYKEDTQSEGMVYCHVGQDTGDGTVPRVYPSVSGIAGIGCAGEALNFADDAVFVSKRGLDAIGKLRVDYERSIVHRSSRIDAQLTEKDLHNSCLAEWKGYLVLLCPDGDVWLADSRRMSSDGDSGMQYEWFLLSGIGGYSSDIPVYRYASAYPADVRSMKAGEADILLSEHPDLPAGGDYESYEGMYETNIIGGDVTVANGDGDETVSAAVWCRETDGDGETVLYLLYDSNERTGGVLSPAKTVSAIGERLYFGTAEGHVLCANTDLRGVPDACARDSTEAFPHRLIDRSNYHICRHRYRSGIVTCADDVMMPTYAKDTVNGSCAVSLMPLPGGRVKLNVGTDREGWKKIGEYTVGELDFSGFDMGQAVLNSLNPVCTVFREKTKRWAKKQYALYSDEYCRPFGVTQIAYSATVAGRMKPQ